jgi:hypothetical protein
MSRPGATTLTNGPVIESSSTLPSRVIPPTAITLSDVAASAAG